MENGRWKKGEGREKNGKWQMDDEKRRGGSGRDAFLLDTTGMAA